MDPDETDEERDTRVNARINSDEEYGVLTSTYGFDCHEDDDGCSSQQHPSA